MFRRSIIALALLAMAALGCKSGSTPTSPSAPPRAPYSQTDLRVGTGTEAVTGRRVVVNYAGWLYDPSGVDGKGRGFDARAGFSFVLGTTVINGWNQGIPGMRVGGIRRLVIPPELGYGNVPNGSIPANSTLVFDVELVEVQ